MAGLRRLCPSAARARTTLASAPDQFFTSGDARIRYREIGQGEPVVLLHGLTMSLEEWLAAAGSLAPGLLSSPTSAASNRYAVKTGHCPDSDPGPKPLLRQVPRTSPRIFDTPCSCERTRG
jgi:hypothetical protein